MNRCTKQKWVSDMVTWTSFFSTSLETQGFAWTSSFTCGVACSASSPLDKISQWRTCVKSSSWRRPIARLQTQGRSDGAPCRWRKSPLTSLAERRAKTDSSDIKVMEKLRISSEALISSVEALVVGSGSCRCASLSCVLGAVPTLESDQGGHSGSCGRLPPMKEGTKAVCSVSVNSSIPSIMRCIDTGDDVMRTRESCRPTRRWRGLRSQ
mmetsp:Transcript_689/g.2777  ORF Transcript_689/g.2777 Transcript_689/m.2777 type:complete len:210 (-) Transcript_689:968-1597(-)